MLAFSNSKFVSGAGTLEHFISDHQPIYLIHKKSRDKRESVEFKGRSYRKYEKERFQNELRSADWDEYYRSDNPEKAWDFLFEQITTVLDKMCPLRKFKIKNYRPEWMSDELIEQIKDRDYFYRKAKKEGGEDAWNIAKYLRNTTNSNIRQAKRDFILGELENNEGNAKKFWEVIRQVIPSGKSSHNKDIMLKVKGVNLEKGQVADHINEFFINVGKVASKSCRKDVGGRKQHEQRPGLEGFDDVRSVEVFKVIKAINTSKSSGLENISSFIIKEAFSMLTSEVTYMYNLSLTTGIFPDKWKMGLVIPIPKTGDLTKVQNYRPISLLPLPGKILEKLAHQQLYNYLENQELLSDAQHAFRKSHSTIHSIAQLVNFGLRAIYMEGGRES